MIQPASIGHNPRHKFVRSSYWHTWSRTLLVQYRGWQTVELDLTPINHTHPSVWEDIKLEKIRCHATPRTVKDTETNQLPGPWFAEIGKQVGNQLRHKLMTFDYVKAINWDAFDRAQRRSSGGGVPLADIMAEMNNAPV